MAARRIEAEQAHDDVLTGALLVCAYDEDAKFQKYRLDGALALSEFRAKEQSLARNQEIIFYCA